MNNHVRVDGLSGPEALSDIGERWTLMIIWASMQGITRFDDYQRHLSVARNILSSRLARLVELGILTKVPVHEGARRMEYRLTDKGADLRNVMADISRWNMRWNAV